MIAYNISEAARLTYLESLTTSLLSFGNKTCSFYTSLFELSFYGNYDGVSFVKEMQAFKTHALENFFLTFEVENKWFKLVMQ